MEGTKTVKGEDRERRAEKRAEFAARCEPHNEAFVLLAEAEAAVRKVVLQSGDRDEAEDLIGQLRVLVFNYYPQ